MHPIFAIAIVIYLWGIYENISDARKAFININKLNYTIYWYDYIFVGFLILGSWLTTLLFYLNSLIKKNKDKKLI